MIENFERILLDEWLYIPLMLMAMIGSFGLGFIVGSIWALAL